MKWENKGLIFCPDGSVDWMNNSVLTPEPYLLNCDTIRIYASFRDKSGIGRIGYLDLDSRDPSRILCISPKPVLNIGKDGCFHDNGIILGDVIDVGDEIYMYYVSFQKVLKAKFLAFSGLAISTDHGESFSHIQDYPVMDRTSEGLYGRCIHTVIKDGDVFKVWYSVIYDWTYINNIPYPTYDIKYVESTDGIHFPDEGVSCIKCSGNEYRIGRPKVFKKNSIYGMFYTSDTYDKEYISGYAESPDGIHWTRKDEEFPLKKSGTYFDSEMLCYPVPIKTESGTYIFFDGNGMGRAGFGYAVLSEE